MQIFVKTVSGHTLLLNVELGNTVSELKQKIQERNGTPIRLQSLVYAAKPLLDHLTLGDCAVCDNATIFLALRLHGGLAWPSLPLQSAY